MRHPQHWYFPEFRCNMRSEALSEGEIDQKQPGIRREPSSPSRAPQTVSGWLSGKRFRLSHGRSWVRVPVGSVIVRCSASLTK